ncbi:hypothetical protein [Methylobacillus flagellatus]|uniref:hypothetical protein n=1 Tax=Methylobacillus flagellatus TaxID=405 RepID=UPI0010F775E1|nr:hypothetical protein [Methylobacillus flagellatus]
MTKKQTTELPATQPLPATPIRQRRVLFISGFDPRGPRHYHALLQAESAKAAAVTGSRYQFGARKNHSPLVSTWTVSGETAGDAEPIRTETRFDFLRWDDVARQLWPKAGWACLALNIKVVWWFAATGYLRRVAEVRRWYVLTMLQPMLAMLSVLFGLVLAGVLLAATVIAWTDASWHWLWAGVALGCAGLTSALKQMEKYSSVLWRGQLNYVYQQQFLGKADVLERRIDQLAESIIAAAADTDADELLIIGHSVGTTVAISSLARALRQQPQAFAHLPQLSFATLGSMAPLLAVEPNCGWFQAEVEYLALHPQLNWVDVGAPLDRVCFSLVDPLLASGRQRPPGVAVKPLLTSPRFHTLFDEADYALLKQDLGRLHTQYLLATPKPGRYDFFAIIAGPLSLQARFQDKEPGNGHEKA